MARRCCDCDRPISILAKRCQLCHFKKNEKALRKGNSEAWARWKSLPDAEKEPVRRRMKKARIASQSESSRAKRGEIAKSAPWNIQRWRETHTRKAAAISRANAKAMSDSVCSSPEKLEARSKAISKGLRLLHETNPEAAARQSKISKKNLGRYFRNSENALEKRLHDMLDDMKSGFVFTGDGSFMIGSKYPDFVNHDTRCVIELFGDAWHTEDEAKGRIRYFAKHGWACVVLWGSDFDRRRSEARRELESFVAFRKSKAISIRPWMQSRARGWLGPLRAKRGKP